ncbi:ankyrin repeat-containing domain protein [Schizophyllum commune]
MKGQEDIITVLLDAGADKESRDVDGCTALHYATRGAYLGAVSLLLERGADVNAPEKTGKTALHFAATGVILRSAAEERSVVEGPAPSMRPNIEVARALINSGAHADSQDDNGNQPLHLAAFHEEEGIVGLLIAAGVSPTSPNRIGRIPEDGIGTNSQLSACPARRERVRQLLGAGMTVMGDQK